MSEPRVSVIIASWNAGGVLGACLESVQRQRVRGGFETIVIDDASTDATPALLRGYTDRILVIRNESSALYSGANNQAAAVARGRVLCFLNSDTELLDHDALDRLAQACEDPEVGIVGPMLLNPDGSLQPSCAAHPSVTRAILVGSGLHRLLPDAARATLVPDLWSHDRSENTGWVKGAALAMRADVFRDLGGFWSTMYGEEEDLAYRVEERGLCVRFNRSVRVMHIGNHSVAQRWSDAERAARIAAAQLAFLAAHYGPLRRSTIRAITGAAYAARTFAHSALGRRERAAVFRSMARVYAAGGRVSGARVP